MTPSRSSKMVDKNISIDCGKYLLRTLDVDDASDHWGNWMTDPEAVYMLNAPARKMTKAEVIDYINRFDQKSRLLIGIFERRTGLHIGFLTIDIDHLKGTFLVNMLIGEPEYRNKGVTNEITEPFRSYFFETLGLKRIMATALARNHVIVHYLLKTGWKLDKTLKQHVKSRSDETMLDLCFFSQSREEWRVWKKASLANGRNPLVREQST
jgi:RimJ/RimL family protein N-acetyltransferase